jgi:hypothetical protein
MIERGLAGKLVPGFVELAAIPGESLEDARSAISIDESTKRRENQIKSVV